MQNQALVRHLSIVIPAYNEERRIHDSLVRLRDYLSVQSYTHEVVVFDDGSTDTTLEILEAFASQYHSLKILHHPHNRGKGFAVRQGALSASGEHILVCDADMATPIEELDRFWTYLVDGADIVIASRPLKDSKLVMRQPIYRELAGRAFNLLVKIVAVPGIRDTQCGFKLFRREAALDIFPLCSSDGFGLDIEVLHIAQKLRLKIVEAPVHWYHRSGSKVRLFQDGLRMTVDLFRVRLRHRNIGKLVDHEAGRV